MSEAEKSKELEESMSTEELPDPDVDEQLSGFGGQGETEDAESLSEKSNTNNDTDPTEEKSVENDKEDSTENVVESKQAEAKSQEKEIVSPPSSKAHRLKVHRIAKERFKEEFGEELDLFDEEHQSAFIGIYSEVDAETKEAARKVIKAQESHKTLSESVNSILPTADMQRFADEAFLDLSTRQSDKIKLAIQNGDIQPMVDFCKSAAKSFESRSNAGKKIQEINNRRKTPPPPVLEGSGGRGEAGVASDDSMDQLAGFGLA